MRTRADRTTPRLGILFLLPCLLGGCGGSYGGDSALLGDLARGEEAFQKAHFEDAILHLERFQETQPGSRFMDKALFLLGKSHQAQREFLLASDDFLRLLDDFPQSEYSEEATFELARSAYMDSKGPDFDATPTVEAISRFRQYAARYPGGAHIAAAEASIRELEDRLVRKACSNGRTYLKLQRPAAAEYYFNKGIAIRSDVDLSSCLLGLAEAHEAQEKWGDAAAAYRRLIEWLDAEGGGILSGGEAADLRKSARAAAERLERLVEESGPSPGGEVGEGKISPMTSTEGR
jgi:outer membrane protein assembly factor BamD (BamD/ComL family)